MQAVLDYAVNLFEEAKKESVSKIDINYSFQEKEWGLYRKTVSPIILYQTYGCYL